MKQIYDPRYNIAYLQFHEKTVQVETLRLSDELNGDIAPDGAVYGIEMLNANQQFRSEDNSNLVVVNEALAQRQEIPLSRQLRNEGAMRINCGAEADALYIRLLEGQRQGRTFGAGDDPSRAEVFP